MTVYFGELSQNGAVRGTAPVDVVGAQPSPRIVNNNSTAPRIEWDAVPGATEYKTFWNGTYQHHTDTTRSWTITPTFPGTTATIGWTYFDGADHWITPELSVTFSGTAPPPPPPTGKIFGLVANSDQSKAIESARRVGATLLRCEFGYNESDSNLRARANECIGKGMRMLPHAAIDGAYDAAANQMGRWARALSGLVTWAGLGNENGYSYKGTQGTGAAYGRAALVAKNLMAGTGVTLVAQADDGNTGSGWIGAMVNAAPGLRTGVVFDVHPYGQRTAWEPRIQRTLDELRSAGVVDPKLIISEWGISTDNGATLSDNYGWPRNMTYSQAGDAVRTDINAMFSRFPEILAITYFQAHDQLPSGTGERERYFGVVKNDQSDKVGLTDDIRFLTTTYK